jgi:hypothetical protein
MVLRLYMVGQREVCKMSVDLSKAKAGNTVYFRVGGKAVIKTIAEVRYSVLPEVNILFEGQGQYLNYRPGGGYGCENHLFDIVRVGMK